MFGDKLHSLDSSDDLGREVVDGRVLIGVVVVVVPRRRSAADACASGLQRREHVGRGRRRSQSVADPITTRTSDVNVCGRSVSEVAKFDAVARADDNLGCEIAVDGGTSHAQQTRQVDEEDALDPRRHGVRRRTAEVDVEDDHGDDDRQRHEHHREQQVLADEWNDQRRRRNDVGQQQEEHGQREQNGNTQSDLFTADKRASLPPINQSINQLGKPYTLSLE